MTKAAPQEGCKTCFCAGCAVGEVNKVYALNSALDYAYSVFGVGLVFFDHNLNLTHLNELARIKLTLPEEFIVMGGDVITECFSLQTQKELKNAINVLINHKNSNEIYLNAIIREEKSTLMLQRLENSAFGITAPGVVMFMLDSNLDNDKSSADIARIFGLTKAEARLTQAIANGMTAAEYSALHGISINTAYSQIKAILAKTGTQRQAELIKLVLEHSPRLERRKNKIAIADMTADRRLQQRIQAA